MSIQSESTLLTSWKEIASYLGKGVRTVQRYEVKFGLPVRRPTENRGIVLVFREELDRWLVQWSQRLKSEQADGSTTIDCAGQVQISRELREEQRRLRKDLLRSLSNLSDECRALALHVTPRQDTPSGTDKRVSGAANISGDHALPSNGRHN